MSLDVRRIAAALRVLASAIENEDAPEAPGTGPTSEPAPLAPQKRGRGRPVKGEDAPAAAPAAPTAAPAAPVADDPFATPAPVTAPVPAATLEQVREALTKLKAATSQENAVAVLKSAGGVENLSSLAADKYGAVVAAATQALAQPASVPATPDPFDIPAAAPTTTVAEPTYSLEDVKKEAVEAQKRTAADTVQKVVMKHGGSAPDPQGGPAKPSLKALPPSSFAAVIAELKALPATK